jgi:hypothetical protein
MPDFRAAARGELGARDMRNMNVRKSNLGKVFRGRVEPLVAPLALGCVALVINLASAQTPVPSAKPVPRAQVLPWPDFQAIFQREGVELARYWFSPAQRRPFVYPIIGPAGRSLTRMGHPHDPESHSHHNSVWISHHDVNGLSFWDDRAEGRIVHRRIEEYADGPDTAAVISVNEWIRADGTVLLIERRRTATQLLPGNEWLLLIDLWLEPKGDPVVLGKTPFGLVGVRMAKTIGVNDGGGTIRNSEGGVNELGVFWQRARWVDYSGPITPQAAEGIALMDHPANPNHPSFFHVRNDGWMGASLTYEGPRPLEAGKPLKLRYGLYVHAGTPEPQRLDQQWASFAQSPPFDLRPHKN